MDCAQRLHRLDGYGQAVNGGDEDIAGREACEDRRRRENARAHRRHDKGQECAQIAESARQLPACRPQALQTSRALSSEPRHHGYLVVFVPVLPQSLQSGSALRKPGPAAQSEPISAPKLLLFLSIQVDFCAFLPNRGRELQSGRFWLILAEAVGLILSWDSDLIEIVGPVAAGDADGCRHLLRHRPAARRCGRRFPFPGRMAVIVILNSLMGLPPVVVGADRLPDVVRRRPLGPLQLLYTRQR